MSALLTPSLGAVVLHRLAHCLHARGAFRAAAALSLANVLIHKTAITPVSCIDAGLFLPHPVGLVFHGCAGKRLTLYANVVCAELGAVGTGPVESGPCLGNDVVVGVHAAVLGSVQVGDGIRIGFGSVLREDAGEAGVIASGRSRVRIETRL